MKLANCKYNILSFNAGAHSCSVTYIKEGVLIATLEEERLLRQKCFVDFEFYLEFLPLWPSQIFY